MSLSDGSVSQATIHTHRITNDIHIQQAISRYAWHLEPERTDGGHRGVLKSRIGQSHTGVSREVHLQRTNSDPKPIRNRGSTHGKVNSNRTSWSPESSLPPRRRLAPAASTPKMIDLLLHDTATNQRAPHIISHHFTRFIYTRA